jgi:long-chain acyl-CoA synthetase
MAHGLVSAVLFDSLGPDSIEYIMQHSESVLMITTIDRIANVLSIVQNCPTVKAIISMDSLKAPSGQKLVAEGKAKGVQVIEFDVVEAMGRGVGRVPTNYGRGDDFLTLAYTRFVTSVFGIYCRAHQYLSSTVEQPASPKVPS